MSLAIGAVSSGLHGHGLNNYYMKYTCDKTMKAELAWRILLRRIQVWCVFSNEDKN